MVIASPAILYALARLAVVFPALLLERLTPLEALRRAFRLTSGSAVPILALILVATFLYLFLQLALGTVVRWVFMSLGLLFGVESLGLLFTRSEEHTSALQSLMRISYAVFCLKKKKKHTNIVV